MGTTACPGRRVFVVFLVFVCINASFSERPADTIYITSTTEPIPSSTAPSTTTAIPPVSNTNDKPKRTLASTLGYGGYGVGGNPYWTTFLQVAPLRDNVHQHQPSASTLNATAAPLFPLGGLSLVPALYPDPLLTQQSYYSTPAIQSASVLSKPSTTSTSPQKFPVNLVQQYPVVGGVPPTTGLVNGGLPTPSLPQTQLYPGAISLEEARQKYPQFFTNQFLPQQRPQYIAPPNTHFNSPQTIYRPLPILSSLPPPTIKPVQGPSPVPQVTESPEDRLEKGRHRFGSYKNSRPHYSPSVGQVKDEGKPPSSGYKYVIDHPGLKGLTPAPETKQKYYSEAPIDDSKSYYKKRPTSPQSTPPESSDSYRGDQRNNNDDDDDESEKQEKDDDDDEEEDDDNGSRSYSYYRRHPSHNTDEDSEDEEEDKDRAEDSQDYYSHQRPDTAQSSRSSYPPASPFIITAQRDEPSIDHYDKLRFNSELQDSFGGFSSNAAPKVKSHSYYPGVDGSLGKYSRYQKKVTTPTDSTRESSHIDSKKRTPAEPVQTFHKYRFRLPDYARVEATEGDEDSEGRYSNITPLRLEEESQKSKYYDVTYVKKESQSR